MKTKLIFLVTILSLFLSCDEDESGNGDLIIAVSNASNNSISMQVLLDNVNQGSFVVIATQQGSYSNLCNDKVTAATLQNVKILNFVSYGNHNLKLKNDSTGHIYYDDSIELNKECGVKQFFLN